MPIFVKKTDTSKPSDENPKYSRIDDVRFSKQKIILGYHGNVLVYVAQVPNDNYIKKPDYSKITSISDETIYQANEDVWVNISRVGDWTPRLFVSKKSDMSDKITLLTGAGAWGITGAKGGASIYVPKGYYYQSTGGNTAYRIETQKSKKGIPYTIKDKMVKIPDYTKGVTVNQNSINFANKPVWFLSSGSNRDVKISKSSDMSQPIILADGIAGNTSEPTGIFYIPKGWYFTSNGSENIYFPIVE